MKKIIDVIEKIQKLYFELVDEFAKTQPNKINLKNKQVRDLKISNNFNYVVSFHKYITSKLVDKSLNGLSIDKYRIKNLLSIIDKIDRYINHPALQGKSSINKCLNDILGFRLLENC